MEGDKGASALHVAVLDRKVHQVIAILEATPELVHARDLRGQTPLHWAAKLGELEMVRLLCQYGASLSAQDDGIDAGGVNDGSDPQPRIPLDVANTKEIEMYLQAAGDARNRPLKLELPDWTGAFFHRMQKLGKAYTSLSKEAAFLQRASPLVAVARFPVHDRSWSRLERFVEGSLSSLCLLQAAYLANQHVKTSRLAAMIMAFESSVHAKARIDALLAKLEEGQKEADQEHQDQKMKLLVVKDEQLRKAETRITELEKQLQEARDELAGTQQERDDALATIHQLRQDNTRLQRNIPLPKPSSMTPTTSSSSKSVEGQLASTPKAVCDPPAEVVVDDSHLPRELQVLRSIRRDRGYDVSIPTAQMQTTLATLYKSLDSALQKLSEDIYSSSSRFILELIQNADDNHYLPEQSPSFALELNPSERFVYSYNNEMGFTEANVRSICQIGDSTKVDAARYIGRKGVGFKSVFKVTDRPHVFSNNFNFHFDSQKPLGYIVPELIDVLERVQSDPSFASLCSNNLHFRSLVKGDLKGTVFYLPLRGEKEVQMDELVDDLAGADHTLLFLRRLVTLDLTIDVTEKTKQYPSPGKWRTTTRLLTTRHEEIEQAIETRRYLDSVEIPPVVRTKYKVFRKALEVPAHLVDRGRDGGSSSSTEITLAFPLTDSTEEPIPLQMVYAFLPVRCVGLHFIVQGDFQLVTSRQDVHRTKPFNAWLRDQIAQLFVACIREDAYVRSRLNVFVPDESEVGDPFWRVLVDKLWALLESENCIPCESGRLLAPKQVLVKPLDFDDLITNDELLQCVGKEFLAGSFDRTRALTKLRLEGFGPKDLVQCLRNPALKLQDRPPAWFSKLYGVLQRFDADLVERFLPELSSQPIFALRTDEPGKWQVSSKVACKGSLFLNLPAILDQSQQEVLPSSVINVLHPDSIVAPGADLFLRKLGVAVPTIQTLVDMFVLHHSSGLVLRMPRSLFAVASHLRFICQHLEDYLRQPGANAPALKSLLLVPTTSGQLKHAHQVYFASCQPLWNGLEGKCDVHYVDEKAVLEKTLDIDKAHKFLKFLGVQDTPRLTVSLTVHDSSAAQAPGLASKSKSMPTPDELYGLFTEKAVVTTPEGTYELVPSPELEAVLEDGSSARVGLLIQLIDSAWESVPYENCPKLWTKLKTLHAPTTLGDTRAFSSCYSQLLKSRFGDALPYLTWPVSHRAVMLALNVTMDMSPSVAVEVIELLAREKRGVPSTWHAIYSYLTDADSTNSLTPFVGRLRAIPILCVARPSFTGHQGAPSDYFEPRDKLRWAGNKDIAASAGITLLADQGFSQWHDLMLNVLDIPNNLSIPDYVRGFSNLTKNRESVLCDASLATLPAEPLLNENRDRHFQQDKRWDALLQHYGNLERLVASVNVSSDTDWIGMPLLLWRLGNYVPIWYYWRVNEPVPSYPDNEELVTMFQELEPLLLHPIFTTNYPGLLHRLGSEPFSHHVKSSFVPQERHGVYHNLAVSMLYRRAVSLAYGITMTEGNDEPENMNEQAVARMSDLLELERRMMQFIHVYDVNKLLVNYWVQGESPEDKIEYEKEETFFYQPPLASRFPRLFLSTQKRSKNQLDFEALNAITGIPTVKLERFFGSQHIKDLMTAELAESALRTVDEQREWKNLLQQANDIAAEDRAAEQRRRPGNGMRGNGPRLSQMDSSRRQQVEGGGSSRFRGDHRSQQMNERVGHQKAFVLDRLRQMQTNSLIGQIDENDRDLASAIDWAVPGDEKFVGGSGNGGRNDVGSLGRGAGDGSDFNPSNKPRELQGMHRPHGDEMIRANRPFINVNDPTSTALTAETLEAQERSGPLDQLQAREFSDRVPRKVFDGTMFSSLHPASSVHMLRELPPVSREQLEGIMHALGHLETEHKCSYLRMDDDDCSSQFDKALEVAAPNNSIFSIAKEQMGLPTIVGRREAMDAYAPDDADVDEYVYTQALDHRVGQLAELFLFKLLTRTLGPNNFGPMNWVSRTRERFFADLGPGDNRAGYDFRFTDTTGSMGPAGRTYCVEVKGQLSHTKKTVNMSANEWKISKSLGESKDSVYVLAIIAISPDPPMMLQWLENPHELMSRGWLDVIPDGYRVRVRIPWLNGLDGAQFPVTNL